METGNRVFVWYPQDDMRHERLLVGHILGGTWLIATPTGHVYAEHLNLAAGDVTGLVMGTRAGGKPRALGNACSFRFEGLTRSAADAIIRGAILFLAQEREAASLAVLSPPEGSPDPDGAGPWRLVEACGDLRPDAPWAPSLCAVLGRRRWYDVVGETEIGLARGLPDEEVDVFLRRMGLSVGNRPPGAPDARVLPIATRSSDQRRERSFPNVAEDIRQEELEDFCVRGPRTSFWCVQLLARQQTHPEDYHRHWKTRHKLPDADWGVSVHSMALRTVALAGCNDQLDVSNICALEHVLREAQLVEYWYHNQERDNEERTRKQSKAGGPGADEIDLFRGSLKGSNQSMIYPELTELIGRQLERDANIMKQTCKAWQERALVRSSN